MKKIHKSVLVLLVVLISFGYAFAKQQENVSTSSKSMQIIVSATGGRVRSRPSLQSEILKQMTIGTILPMIDQNKGWFKVLLPKEDEKEKAGWISKSITSTFDEAKRDGIYKRIADKYFKRKSLSFNTARELFDFLGPAADSAKTYEVGGDLRLKRLLALSAALKSIRPDRFDRAPYKEFLAEHKDEIVYSEPAAEWYVRSNNFWELHERYKKYRIGETIAWKATANPLPGECEGYINCYLYIIRTTNGEYLNFYPNGKYSRQALRDTINMLEPIVADLKRKSVYYTASDISDRAEFNKYLAQLRTIISKTPYIEKHRALKQILKIAEAHR